MSPIDWATLPLKKYANFSGRAPRAEYWWYTLFVAVAALVVMIVDNMLGFPKLFMLYGPLTALLMLGTFVPSISVFVRRLHDTDRSGWWAGALWLVYAAYLWSMRGMLAAMASIDPADPNPDPAAVHAIAAQSGGSMMMGMLLGLAVVILGIAILVFLCSAGTKGDNRYGPDPYAP